MSDIDSRMSENPPLHIVARAIEIASTSRCAKSQRGVVVYYAGEELAAASNTPLTGCTGSAECRTHCSKLCEHAETRALRLSLDDGYGHLIEEMNLLHIRVIDGKPVESGPPSCWQCSRRMLALGVRGIWLLHEDGWRYYLTADFHEQTHLNCGISK